ncbi:hypothetical protein RRG08_066092 [Elysia crispata]|uniref:Uncharacterized protein n=1 Tax=Elysia crispata TaxID=231223 RepID=A0AAE1DG54_9GAST|nr:hypothetical protein RRG08_066092 [Elysia crispata]
MDDRSNWSFLHGPVWRTHSETNNIDQHILSCTDTPVEAQTPRLTEGGFKSLRLENSMVCERLVCDIWEYLAAKVKGHKKDQHV